MRAVRHVSLPDLQLSRLHPLRVVRGTTRGSARGAERAATGRRALIARIRSAIAPLLAEPRISSERVSERVHGQLLELLEWRGAWHRVRGADGYEGWTHEGYLDVGVMAAGSASASESAAALAAASVPDAESTEAWRISQGCTALLAGSRSLALPLGALLPPDAVVLAGRASGVMPATPDAVSATAQNAFAGTPYMWGGVTPWGADCSGFVQTVFRLHGVALLRDASQQATLGEPADGARPGDLLFFSEREDGRITHVAIALGADAFAHVALGRGGFAVERRDADDPYVVGLLAHHRFARRVI